MTVSNQTNRTSAVGASAVLEIPYLFPTTQSGDLRVIMRLISTGNETVLTEGASSEGYTATYSSIGGLVTTSDSITALYQVHVIRNTPMTQLLDLVQGGNFNAENVEAALDKGVRLIIENADALSNKAIVFPPTDASALTTELPNAIDRASKNLTFDSSGNVTASDSVEEGSVSFTTFGENMAEAANALASKAVINLDHVFDVRDYGAVGDGSTDDTVEIQAAITAAAAAKGVVYFPPSTTSYMVSTGVTAVTKGAAGVGTETPSLLLPTNSHLTGPQGEGTAVIEMIAATSDEQSILHSVEGADNISIRNLTIKRTVADVGADSLKMASICMFDSCDFIIEDVYINGGIRGIMSLPSDGSTVTNGQIKRCKVRTVLQGISTTLEDDTSYRAAGWDNFVIDDNDVELSGTDEASLIAMSLQNMTNSKVTNNKLIEGRYSLSIGWTTEYWVALTWSVSNTKTNYIAHNLMSSAWSGGGGTFFDNTVDWSLQTSHAASAIYAAEITFGDQMINNTIKNLTGEHGGVSAPGNALIFGNKFMNFANSSYPSIALPSHGDQTTPDRDTAAGLFDYTSLRIIANIFDTVDKGIFHVSSTAATDGDLLTELTDYSGIIILGNTFKNLIDVPIYLRFDKFITIGTNVFINNNTANTSSSGHTSSCIFVHRNTHHLAIKDNMFLETNAASGSVHAISFGSTANDYLIVKDNTAHGVVGGLFDGDFDYAITSSNPSRYIVRDNMSSYERPVGPMNEADMVSYENAAVYYENEAVSSANL